MKLKNTLLMAAFGLIMSALVAQSANIQITHLPFTIAAPGTYVITGNLSFTAPTPPNASTFYTAILIPTSLPGPVILDLKGFTLTSNGPNATASVGVGIGGTFVGPLIANAFPITVRNGGLNSFDVGIWASQAAAVIPPPLTNIEVSNMSFLSGGIIFLEVNSSTVKNCTFNNCGVSISDTLSAGGNEYSTLTFNNVGETLVLASGRGVVGLPNTTIVLNDCRFAPPAN
jgi:hypothetical protein